MLDDVSNRAANLDSYRERITNFSNEFDLGLFLYIFKRSLVWITLCVLLSFSAAWIYLRYTPNTYDSKVLLQLKESNNAQKVLEVNPLMESTNLNADVELLKSKFFIAKALKRLPLEVSYYFKGNILTKEFYTESFFIVDELVVLDPEVRGTPITMDVGADGNGRVSYMIGTERFFADYVVGSPFATPHFRCVIRPVEGSTLVPPDKDGKLYFVINDPKALVARFRGQLQAGIQDQTAKTVFVNCRDNNKYLARDLAQAMADAFIEYDLERKSESAKSIVKFIESQKDTVFAQLKDSEIRLQRFRTDNRVSDMEQLMPLLLERSNEYENKILELQIEDNLLEQIERSTNTDPDKIDVYELVPLLVGTSYEQTLSSLIDKLESLLNERREALIDVKESNMAVQEIEKQISLQKRLIMESIATLRERIEGKMNDYEERINEYEGRFTSLPEKQLAFSRIQRLFNINEKYYIDLLEKDIEYRISKAGYVADNRVLEEAPLPEAPVSPDRSLVYVSYLLTGITLGLLIVLVRYILHDNITSLNDIAKLSNASIGILGMVPKYKKEIPVSQLLIDKNPKSLIAESFRSVRTNLQFVDNTPGPKVVAITSTISGEGKTFVAINLAGIISFSGKRVIVLDLDMRKPKIHLGFGVENMRGMSTLLIDKDSIEDCVQHSTLKGLDFITAGPIPPNPSELILGARMMEIVNTLKESYDLILIDNPPVGLVTDGISMIQMADYPIYIFRADYSKKVFVHNVDRLINENRIRKLSAVLNGVDIDRNKYGYSYGYGYGYSSYGSGYYDDRGVRGRARRGRTKLSRILKGA